jgi:hypothetical protein
MSIDISSYNFQKVSPSVDNETDTSIVLLDVADHQEAGKSSCGKKALVNEN